MVIATRQTTLETVAAGQTAQALGATGNAGDIIEVILAVPASTSPGAISIKDGTAGSAITVFAGGASSLSNLAPFPIPIGVNGEKARNAEGWLLTTGANIAVVAFGRFT